MSDVLEILRIIASLESGSAPAEMQRRLAQILKNSLTSDCKPKRLSLRSRGRPEGRGDELEYFKMFMVIDALVISDWQNEEAHKFALVAFAKVSNIKMETVRTYWRKGRSLACRRVASLLKSGKLIDSQNDVLIYDGHVRDHEDYIFSVPEFLECFNQMQLYWRLALDVMDAGWSESQKDDFVVGELSKWVRTPAIFKTTENK